MPAVDNKGLTIEIGDNLLEAIGLILNLVEKENKSNSLRKLYPGKEGKK